MGTGLGRLGTGGGGEEATGNGPGWVWSWMPRKSRASCHRDIGARKMEGPFARHRGSRIAKQMEEIRNLRKALSTR